MARQKVRMGKEESREHEASESMNFEKQEEKVDKKHFVHEGMENIPDHRRRHYSKGIAV